MTHISINCEQMVQAPKQSRCGVRYAGRYDRENADEALLDRELRVRTCLRNHQGTALYCRRISPARRQSCHDDHRSRTHTGERVDGGMRGWMHGLLQGRWGRVTFGTYRILVTLLVSHLPMSRSNDKVPSNILLHMTHIRQQPGDRMVQAAEQVECGLRGAGDKR